MLFEKFVLIDIIIEIDSILYGLNFLIIIKMIWKKNSVIKNYNVNIGLKGLSCNLLFLFVKK